MAQARFEAQAVLGRIIGKLATCLTGLLPTWLMPTCPQTAIIESLSYG
jgi:hypothetical protein